jgi:hypothetical protein
MPRLTSPALARALNDTAMKMPPTHGRLHVRCRRALCAGARRLRTHCVLSAFFNLHHVRQQISVYCFLENTAVK